MSDLIQRIVAIRRDIHAHPELAFGEWRTADRVAQYLVELGLTVHRGLAGTGVVASLSAGHSTCSIGLRADMDALPIQEQNDCPHRSQTPGHMHACGHDGHVAMLLGAAEVIRDLRDAGGFDGTVYFIFQPAEEHEGGGRVMVEQGLFDRFPMQAVFGLHNWPELPAGHLAVMSGPVMAGADRFEIVIQGQGGHAAMPHQASDTIVAGATLVGALQTLVSRSRDPQEPAVLSVTRFHAGHADNVLPEQATLGGTVRTFSVAQQLQMEQEMRRVCAGIGVAHDVRVTLHFEHGYPPTINTLSEASICADVAEQVVGAGCVYHDLRPSMGAEDFAYLLQKRPGCYVWLGSGRGQDGAGGGGCLLHSPQYDFNDDVIPVGIAYWKALVQHVLKVSSWA